MSETHYAKGITAQNLRTFLKLWPLVAIGIEDTKKTINDFDDQLIDKKDDEFAWCHFYEIPTKDLMVLLCTKLLPFVSLDLMLDWFRQMADCPTRYLQSNTKSF